MQIQKRDTKIAIDIKNSFKFIIGKSGKWINFKLCGREKIHAPGANPNSTVPLEPLVN